MSILSRLRGAIGMTVTWTAAWAVFGVLFRLVWPYEWTGMPSLAMLASSAASWLIPGAVAGLSFSLFLGTQSKHRLEDLARGRMTVLGAVGGIAVPLLVGAGSMLTSDRSMSWMLQPLAQWAIAGAACAAGSLSVARRAVAARETGELLAAELTTDIGLAERDGYELRR